MSWLSGKAGYTQRAAVKQSAEAKHKAALEQAWCTWPLNDPDPAADVLREVKSSGQIFLCMLIFDPENT